MSYRNLRGKKWQKNGQVAKSQKYLKKGFLQEVCWIEKSSFHFERCLYIRLYLYNLYSPRKKVSFFYRVFIRNSIFVRSMEFSPYY